VRLRVGAFALLLCVPACGGARGARPLLSLETPPAGDLPPALPAAGDSSDRAETGRPARLVLGARREQVVALYQRFIHAVEARSGEEIRAIFADSLLNLDTGEVEPREPALQRLEALMQAADTSQLAAALAAEQVRVRSVQEYRRDGRPAPATMRAGDWMLERPPVTGPRIYRPGWNYVSFVPARFLVRWIGERPFIAGASEIRPGR
jgi:hypothetical protein